MLLLASNPVHRRQKCCFWHHIRSTGVSNATSGFISATQASQILVLVSSLVHRRRKCCFWHHIHCTGVANVASGIISTAQASQMLLLASNPLHKRRECCFWHQIRCTGVANAASGCQGCGKLDDRAHAKLIWYTPPKRASERHQKRVPIIAPTMATQSDGQDLHTTLM